MKVHLNSSLKNRNAVQIVADVLRNSLGCEVCDFTDPKRRKPPEIPYEKLSEQFYPQRKNAIEWADLIVILLPCDIDAAVDCVLGVHMGKRSVLVGRLVAGEYLDRLLDIKTVDTVDTIDELYEWIKKLEIETGHRPHG
jgi:hypothetical protein